MGELLEVAVYSFVRPSMKANLFCSVRRVRSRPYSRILALVVDEKKISDKLINLKMSGILHFYGTLAAKIPNPSSS